MSGVAWREREESRKKRMAFMSCGVMRYKACAYLQKEKPLKFGKVALKVKEFG